MRRRIRATSWSRPTEAHDAPTEIIWLVFAFGVFGFMSAAYPDGFPHHLAVRRKKCIGVIARPTHGHVAS